MADIDTSFWARASEDFLADDRPNPARGAAASIIADYARAVGRAQSLVEVGPGMGFDYADHFRPLVEGGVITYTGVEATQAFVDRLRGLYSEVSWVHGTFDSLEPRSVDITYTKATLEHQPDFRAPLAALLRATRSIAVINWYRPPGEVEDVSFHASSRVWYSTFRKCDVLEVIAPFGFCEVRAVPGSTNVLYVINRRGT